MDADELEWNRALREQWELHWDQQLRARLDGLTDDEYFWSPVPDAWSVRPPGRSTAPVQVGAGDFRIDYDFPEPVLRGLGEAGLRVPVGEQEPYPDAPWRIWCCTSTAS